MEYVFGTNGNIKILKTKGMEHSELTGFHQVEREYPDQTITDHFRAVRKFDTAEDGEGNCYDWYEIDNHYRTTEKHTGMEARVSAIEDALCELDAMINGG